MNKFHKTVIAFISFILIFMICCGCTNAVENRVVSSKKNTAKLDLTSNTSTQEASETKKASYDPNVHFECCTYVFNSNSLIIQNITDKGFDFEITAHEELPPRYIDEEDLSTGRLKATALFTDDTKRHAYYDSNLDYALSFSLDDNNIITVKDFYQLNFKYTNFPEINTSLSGLYAHPSKNFINSNQK